MKEDNLNREEKDRVIGELTERLGRTDTILAAEFSGLSVRQLGDLRGRLRGVSAEMAVVKNTLARRAVDATGREGLLPVLKGTSALVWCDGDPAAVAKTLAGFSKETQEALTLKGGLLGNVQLSAADVSRLATIPSREVLLAQLAGGLQAPISGLAGGMNALLSGMARALGAVRDQRAAAEA